MPEEKSLHAYVGTFQFGGESAGIHVVQFDALTGAVAKGDLVPIANPSHLAVANRQGMLYAAAHTAVFDGEFGGAIVAFRIDPENGALSRLNHQIMPFPHPNYIVVDQLERLILATAGLGGGVSAFPIEQGGGVSLATCNLLAAGEPMLKLGETLQDLDRTEFRDRRARSTSPHAVVVDPTNRFAVVMDAGGNRLLLFELVGEPGTLNLHQILATRHSSAAPRHAVFHPDGRHLYVVNEADSSVTIFALDPVGGVLTEEKTLTSLPSERTIGNAMGDVKIDRTGRYLYCSNRGDESITTFSILEGGRDLERIDVTPCLGIHPRGLCLSPDGGFLLVANQGPAWRAHQETAIGSPDAGVVVFAVDRTTGLLSPTGHSVQIDSATCVTFNQRYENRAIGREIHEPV